MRSSPASEISARSWRRAARPPPPRPLQTVARAGQQKTERKAAQRRRRGRSRSRRLGLLRTGRNVRPILTAVGSGGAGGVVAAKKAAVAVPAAPAASGEPSNSPPRQWLAARRRPFFSVMLWRWERSCPWRAGGRAGAGAGARQAQGRRGRRDRIRGGETSESLCERSLACWSSG